MSIQERYFTFLGTGTSQGVPVIGCRCEVCTSTDSRDQRLRTAGMITVKTDNKTTNIVIDAGPDFRQQLLREQVEDIAAIVFTHEHNDHVAGLDDVRPLNFRQQKPMPLFATLSVQKELERRFAYAFDENPYPGAPQLNFVNIQKDRNFQIAGVELIPIEVHHGRDVKVLGFRIGDLTYITDCKAIEPEELSKVMGTKILILNALHHRPHHSHLNLEEALALTDTIQPEKAYFTHISHHLGKAATINPTLPTSISLAYDGLRLPF
jgi:phosphoribosyl 1,2-cyclic phosphate phosphodiesterase